MELIKWNPARDMFSLRHRMNDMVENFFHPFWEDRGENTFWDWHPSVDIYDEDDHIVLKAELPGVDKDNIVVDVKDRVLTLKGERSYDDEVKKDNYYYRERSFGKFERRFTLPVNVNMDLIKAEYKDGLLKIDIPKPEEEKPKKITVH